MKSTESKIQAEKSMDDAVLDTAYFGKNCYLKGKRAVLLLAVIILYNNIDNESYFFIDRNVSEK